MNEQLANDNQRTRARTLSHEIPSIEGQRYPVYMELSHDKNPTGNICALMPKQSKSPLNGLYAYLLVRHDENQKQYLLIDRLKEEKSNHGHLEHFYLKRLPQYSKNAMKILCGGEMTFINDVIVNWNLKSQYTSVALYDSTPMRPNLNFEQNLTDLWLPRELYQPIEEAESYAAGFFSKQGSFKSQLHPETTSPSLDLDSFLTTGGSLDKLFDTTKMTPCASPTLAPPATPKTLATPRR